MYIIIYILLTILYSFMCTNLNPKFERRNNNLIYKKNNIFFKKILKMPWFIILINSSILGLYSVSLGTFGGLIDRKKYIYSFLNRYPQYFSSLKELLNTRIEPGYVLLNVFIRRMTDNPLWLFFIITFIYVSSSIYVSFKLTSKYRGVFFLFLISMYFFQSTYLLKQTLAISISNLALIGYIENKNWKYFLLSLLACMFHSTAIIMFPLYFLFKKSNKKTTYFLIFIFFIFIFIFFYPILNIILPRVPYINQYIEINNLEVYKEAGSYFSILKGIPFYYITFLAILKRKTLEKHLHHSNFFIISSIIYSMSWISTFHMYWSFRIGWYVMLPTLILVPALFKSFKKPKKRFFLGFIFISSLFSLTIRQIIIILY